MLNPVVSVRSLSLDVPDGKVVTFISDVHLGLGDRATDQRREQHLVSLLRSAATRSAHIVIVGDLFDLWFDYSSVIPRWHVRTLAALAECRDAGVPISYLIGNHDFGHHTYFRDELGIKVDLGDVDLTIGSTRLYISHGDGKAHNDTGYLMLRGILRNRVAQLLYRWIHPDLGIGLASATSRTSRDHTSAKDYGPHDGLRDFAAQQTARGYDYVVMGHRHRATVETVGSGTYINLGHWLGEQATYGEYDPRSGFALKHWPPDTAATL